MFVQCVTRDDEPKSQNTLIMKDLSCRYVSDLSDVFPFNRTRQDEPNEMLWKEGKNE